MRLAEFLRLADISQVQFAAQIGVRQPTVSRLVAGTQNPSALTALKIRDASQGAVGPRDWGPVGKSPASVRAGTNLAGKNKHLIRRTRGDAARRLPQH